MEGICLLLFLYPGAKGTPLGSKHDKTHIHSNQEYEAPVHFMHVRQLLTASCGIIVRLCIIYYIVFHQEKNWLCWKYVINHEGKSAIFWNFTQRRTAILTYIVLLDP
jgi:hypothetical protein